MLGMLVLLAAHGDYVITQAAAQATTELDKRKNSP